MRLSRPCLHDPVGAIRFAALVAAVLASLLATPAPAAITIGPGPAAGVDRAGVTWYEEFRDWTAADVIALDDAGLADSGYGFGDGLDDSRDLIAFYYREEGGNLYFRVDLYDLALGAENGSLDIYVAIDAAGGGQPWLPDFLDVQTDRPWELCLGVYNTGTVWGTNYRLYDASFQAVNGAYLGAYFNSAIDAVEFGIAKSALTARGWDGASPLTFQVFTAKDGAETNCTGGGNSSDIADAFTDDDRGCSDGVLNGGMVSTGRGGVVYFASIAHGNQSVNKAGDVGSHIYDPESNTGISGGTGFLRTLDSHEIFKVPLNIHPSGSLLIGTRWAETAGGAADPQNGPAFLARMREFVDDDQTASPGSLIGGVLAEHIMPYFEGPVNAASIAAKDSLMRAVLGVSAAEAMVMHTPERVTRSQSTGLAPLDGHTFQDIEQSPYLATYLDEVTHLHWWFHPGESCVPDQGYRHKIHRINGVYTFMINEREDGQKFANHDGGCTLDIRYSLLQKALYGNSSEIVVVFDDWEALAGKSFDPIGGNIIPNNNPNQYHNTLRWLANHPWIVISNLKDVLLAGLSDPGAFVIDHGYRYDLSMQTYEWLKHAAEDSYNYWYYNQNAGFPGNEQSFYDLVPVITGPQGDYISRGATPAQDGPALPSGMKHGDLNSPNTLMYESWAALDAAPDNRLKEVGVWGFLNMIYETAWHEEDQVNYQDSDCYQDWLFPDTSWDGMNTWALRLQNHVRQAGFYAAAAEWVEDVRTAVQGAATHAVALDLDFDGEAEYVIRNNRTFAVFEKYGGRCVLAVGYDAARQDGEVLIGAPMTNPSAPGEEEYVGTAANRCSAFKDMNGGTYADAAYAAVAAAGGWRFTSPDGLIEKTITAADGSAVLDASYLESVAGSLYVRLGLSPNPIDLAMHGHENLVTELTAASYTLANAAGGSVVVDLAEVAFQASPADAGYLRRNLALTEQVEVAGDGAFHVRVTLVPGAGSQVGIPDGPRQGPFLLRGPAPSPSRGSASMTLAMPEPGRVAYEILAPNGRLVARRDLGVRPAGETVIHLGGDSETEDLGSGVYLVRVLAGDRAASRKWVVVR